MKTTKNKPKLAGAVKALKKGRKPKTPRKPTEWPFGGVVPTSRLGKFYAREFMHYQKSGSHPGLTHAGLIVGPAEEVLPGAVSNSVDMVFVDPPFNIGQDYTGDGGKGDRQPKRTFERWLNRLCESSCRVVRPGGTVVFHVPDELVSVVDVACMSCGMSRRNWVVLHQEFGQYTDARFIRSKVHSLHYAAPGARPTFNVHEVLEPSLRLRIGDKRTATSKHKGLRPFLDVWYGPNLGRVQGNNEERWGKAKLGYDHANQLPEMYLARLIRAYTHPGEVVLDPCAGSGTTLVVACALGRDSIGIEKEPKIAASAWARVMKGAVRDVHAPLAAPVLTKKVDVVCIDDFPEMVVTNPAEVAHYQSSLQRRCEDSASTRKQYVHVKSVPVV